MAETIESTIPEDKASSTNEPITPEGKKRGTDEEWDRYREKVVHEDKLSHERLTLLYISQAFLLTAFAAIFQSLTNKNNFAVEYLQAAVGILAVICIVGIFTCLILTFALSAGFNHLDEIDKGWQENYEEWRPGVSLRYNSPGQVYRVLHSKFLPAVFVSSWAAIATILIFHQINPLNIVVLLVGILGTAGSIWVFAHNQTLTKS